MTRALSLYKFTLSVFYLFASVLIPVFSSGQSYEPCGTMQYLRLQEKINPAYADSILLNEKRIQQWIKDNAGLRIDETNTITIPIVVHVIYNANHPEQNIPDWQIQSQIDVLNEDYRRLNVDTINTPAVFRPLAADCNLQFCLAHRDPLNQPTNGIVRIPTGVTSFSVFDDAIKSSSSGGDNPWPNQRYLNIWVCNVQLPTIGYGTFPGGDPKLDGVVVHYGVFGRYNNKTPGYNLGRTCTHEVGHWLNLHHPWGDNQNGCYDTDYVDDTPNQDSADYGCGPYPRISCNNGPDGDMFSNYMNYSYDYCANLFTQGQKQRMWAAISTSRPAITLSDAGNPVTNYALDIGISHIYFPTAITAIDTVTPVVTLSNYGTDVVTTAEIHYQFYIPARSAFIFNWQGNLNPGQSVNITLPSLRITNQQYINQVFIVYSSNPNGMEDMDTTNDFHSSRSLFVSGVPSLTVGNPFTVYPNPTTGSITLQFDSEDWSNISLQMFNTLGQQQQVTTTISPLNKIIVEMALLPPGIYIMKINYKGQNYIKKIMRLPTL